MKVGGAIVDIAQTLVQRAVALIDSTAVPQLRSEVLTQTETDRILR